MGSAYVHHRSTRRHFAAADVHRVPKAWGEEHWIVNRDYCGKKLLLRKNRRCSLHAHKEKDEVFYIVAGRVLMEIDGEQFTLERGDFVHIRPGETHRFTGIEDSEIIEFSTHHDEADSYRTELSGHADPERYARQSSILGAFKDQSILVIGDVMLDRYTAGSIGRISPEAPVPVVQVNREWEVLGGAANSAANARALGATVRLLGVTGHDAAAGIVASLCEEAGIATMLLEEADRPTTVKQRVVSGSGQQVARVDRECAAPIAARLEQLLLKKLPSLASGASAILVSDYAKGLVTRAVLHGVLAQGRRSGIPVIIDPKPRSGLSVEDVRGATLLTPNVREARELLGTADDGVDALGRALSKRTGAAVFLTRGPDGLDVWEKGKQVAHFASLAPAVVDVSGAGDTVAAVAALALASGASLSDAADMGNRAASVVVAKQGTATLTRAELDAVL